ncbi:MAG: indole-3-glycerol phosphate synthase TrpC [Verrucomicrobiota bacterium]
MNRLQTILDQKRTEIARLLPRLEHLRAAALLRNDYRGFAAALDRGPDALGLIAEVKKASPSVGTIVEHFDPVAIAQAYEAAGAHAISVLTDEKFFQGSLSYLTQIRQAVGLPLLRKDFILHEAQIYEAAVAGADAILLIVAALEQPELERLHETATTLGLDVLVEVHALPELDRALDCGARMIGINNRNLTTFEVDLRATEIISEEVPEGVLLLSESGIKTNADARRVFACGVNALLVGESLMRTGDVPGQVAALLDVG